MIDAVILDLDDTLAKANDLYLEGRAEYYKEMERLGFERDVVEKRFLEVDVEKAKTLGFDKWRFGESMAETYQELAGSDYDPATSAVLARIGHGTVARTMQPQWLEGAEVTLRSLDVAGYYLALMTAGDHEVQLSKIEHLGLGRYFAEIQIVPMKTVETYQKWVASHIGMDPSRVVMVGNSMHSDIAPALEAGLQAIYISGRGWELDHGIEAKGPFVAVPSIADVPSALRSLARKAA